MVLVFCVVFSSGAKADSPTKWTATWNLSNHQTVDFSIAPGSSVFRGWTLNINGPMKRGQVYYIKNQPALLANEQNDGPSFSVHEVFANFDGFYWWVEGDRFFYYADKDADWVRVYVNYNMYNNTSQTWLGNNFSPSSTVTINLSDIPPNLDADHAQDILTALNNINSSVNSTGTMGKSNKAMSGLRHKCASFCIKVSILFTLAENPMISVNEITYQRQIDQQSSSKTHDRHKTAELIINVR